jgi:hypothetical protein
MKYPPHTLAKFWIVWSLQTAFVQTSITTAILQFVSGTLAFAIVKFALIVRRVYPIIPLYEKAIELQETYGEFNAKKYKQFKVENVPRPRKIKTIKNLTPKNKAPEIKEEKNSKKKLSEVKLEKDENSSVLKTHIRNMAQAQAKSDSQEKKKLYKEYLDLLETM